MTENVLTDCWDDVERVFFANINRIFLYGPPGTGKTYAAAHYGNPSSVHDIVCTEDLTSADLTGMWMPNENGSFSFHVGPAILAWYGVNGEGGRLVLNEVDRASGDALSQLLGLTDSPESAYWRNPQTGEIVRPGPNFSVVMTSNVENPDDIPEALKDRFPVKICVDRPPMAAVALLSEDLRDGALFGTGESRLPLRSLYAFDSLRKVYDDETAARLVFGHDGDGIVDALKIAGCGR